MTTEPAKPNRLPGAESAAAIGGPLPPFRLLLTNGNGHGWHAGLGFLLHSAVVAVLFLLPLLMTEQISGSPPWRTVTLLPIQKGDPAAKPTTRPQSSGPQDAGPASDKRPKLALSNQPLGPKRPRGVQIAGPDLGMDSLGIPNGIEGGAPLNPASPYLPVASVPTPAVQPPVRVGGKVRPPRLLRRVEPVYPSLAKQAGIEGTVVLEATLGADGHVEELTVLGGHPLLVEAGQQAVAQWVYEPTYLNERPVPVLLRVTLEFRLLR